jgi:hypothetical protein
MLKTDQEKAAHAELVQRVANLEYRLIVILVTAAVDAIERSRGCITPAETFLEDVLADYAWDRLSPDRVQEHLETYRSDLESMTEDVSDFVRRNPERFQDLAAEILKPAEGRQLTSHAVPQG